MAKNAALAPMTIVQEGVNIGLQNVAGLVGAYILWALTVWIPYLNVGTTIAIMTLPAELSKGKTISPTSIFDKKYRQYMGEFFILQGLMGLGTLFGFMFLYIPGLVIALSWSLATLLLVDKGAAPLQAMQDSNKMMYGNKWSVFFAYLIFGIAVSVVFWVLGFILKYIMVNMLGLIIGGLIFLAFMLIVVASGLGMTAHIYKNASV